MGGPGELVDSVEDGESNVGGEGGWTAWEGQAAKKGLGFGERIKSGGGGWFKNWEGQVEGGELKVGGE